MVNASEKLNNCFSIRFQSVKETRDPRTASLVVSQMKAKEFFNLVEQFGLVAIYTENDVWHVTPNPDTDPKDMENHVSTWDMMLHKYMSASNQFKRENEEYMRKVMSTPIRIPQDIISLDTSGSMAGGSYPLYCGFGKL